MKFIERFKGTNHLGWESALVGLLTMITPTILPVCEGLLELVNGNQVPMRCHWTAQAELALGGVLLVTGLFLAISQSIETKRALSNIVLVLGMAIVLVPIFIIPTCDNPEMACNIGTRPAWLLLGGISMLLGLIGSRPAKQETSFA